jgi:hypothetical protein
MQKVFKQATALAGISILAISSVSCGQSKVAQCNEMVKVSNAAAKVGQEFSSVSKMKDPTEITNFFNTTADKLATHSKSMKALEMKDEKLKGFQTRFVTMYDGTGQGVRDAATALQKKDATTFQKAVVQMQASGSQETALVDEVNKYCSGK